METLKIPSDRIPALLIGLAKLNKRVAKCEGSVPMTLDVVGTEIETRKARDGRKISREISLVQFRGEVPRMNGYAFLARVEHTPKGNIVAKAPNAYETNLDGLRTVSPDCDHCKTKRQRADTFLLEGPKGHMQVGRSCLADFLRSDVAEVAIQFWRFLQDLESARASDEEWDGTCSGGWITSYEVSEFVAATIAMIRHEGWVSGKTAFEYGKTSTASEVCRTFTPLPLSEPRHTEEREWRAKVAPTAKDAAKASEIVAWIASLASKPILSDYEHNLVVACSLDCIRPKHAGIVASGVMAYSREVEELARKKAAAMRPMSTHFGEVKKRYDLTGLEVIKVRPVSSDFGVSTLVMMVDGEGRVFKWFASKELDDLNVGDVVDCRATVKAHDTYDGKAQTALTRAQLTPRKDAQS